MTKELIEALEALKPAADAPELSERAYKQAVDDCIALAKQHQAPAQVDTEANYWKTRYKLLEAKQQSPVVDELKNIHTTILQTVVESIKEARREIEDCDDGDIAAFVTDNTYRAIRPYLTQPSVDLEVCIRAYKDAEDFLDEKLKAVLTAANVKWKE